MKLPNFLIVGAAKSGTTSLFHYLKQHPEVFMPSFKEPQYLVASKVRGRVFKNISVLEDYKGLFEDAGQKAVGEASVFYLYFYKEAIQNIKTILGDDVKIIIVLRNPVDRAFSAYRHVSRNSLTETLSFEEALREEPGRLERNPKMTPMVMYKDMGLYNDAVQAYKESFKDVHIVLYDDFKKDVEESVKGVFCFLNIEKNIKIDFTLKYNVGAWDWSNSFLKKVLFGKHKWKCILKAVLPKVALQLMGQLIRLTGGTKEKKISLKTKEELQTYFSDDIAALSKTIDNELNHWTDVA